jgi:hypothetical protein
LTLSLSMTSLPSVDWSQIGSGYYGVAPYDVSVTESASKIVDAAFVSAFGLSQDEARALFGGTSHFEKTAFRDELPGSAGLQPPLR